MDEEKNEKPVQELSEWAEPVCSIELDAGCEGDDGEGELGAIPGGLLTTSLKYLR